MDEVDIKKISIRITFFLLLLGTIAGIYFFIQYVKTKAILQNPIQMTQAQIKDLVQQVGKIIELPKEDPTVATVLDKTKVQSQSFFARSENGDKVLIFTQAKKAILYRPSENKIIEVAPVNIGPSQASSSGQIGGTKISPTSNPSSPVGK